MTGDSVPQESCWLLTKATTVVLRLPLIWRPPPRCWVCSCCVWNVSLQLAESYDSQRSADFPERIKRRSTQLQLAARKLMSSTRNFPAVMKHIVVLERAALLHLFSLKWLSKVAWVSIEWYWGTLLTYLSQLYCNQQLNVPEPRMANLAELQNVAYVTHLTLTWLTLQL